MATTNCTTKSITLAAGDQFVLPPGATLLGATNVDAITSDCELGTLETTECYVAILAGYSTSNGNTEYFEKQTQRVTGFTLNNQFVAMGPYLNSNTNGAFYPGDIITGLTANIPSIVATGTGLQFHTSNGDNSQTSILIKTFPSIGNNLKLILNSSAPMDSGQEGVNYVVPFLTLQAAIDAGYVGLPACP